MMSALIADDAEIVRVTLRMILTKNGYGLIYEAKDGKEAVETYKTHTPDIVTLDVTMDIVDGIEALKQIMAINPNAKVLMVSAMSQDIIVRDAIKTGAGGFIVKPFTEQQITDALNKLR